MTLTDHQRNHIKRLCNRNYREAQEMINSLEFASWPEDQKTSIRQFLEAQQSNDEAILKELFPPQKISQHAADN